MEHFEESWRSFTFVALADTAMSSDVGLLYPDLEYEYDLVTEQPFLDDEHRPV